MSDGRDLILLYDSSFEGFLSAVFASYSYPKVPVGISTVDCQQQLYCDYIEIKTNEEHAKRVLNGVERAAGACQTVIDAFLYAHEEKNNIIYKFIRLCMSVGFKVNQMLADERVLAINKICSLVQREAMLLKEFVRFSQLENKIYYAELEPEHEILPLIMPHFVDRMNIQPFIINDKTHNVAGVYDLKDWYITDTDNMQLPDYSQTEKEYKALWKIFYDTIAIKERINPKLRRQHMPKKYWRYITELQPDFKTSDNNKPLQLTENKKLLKENIN